jgi:hypothetical protein
LNKHIRFVLKFFNFGLIIGIIVGNFSRLMKKLALIVISFCLSLSFATSQTAVEVISAALKNGDAPALSAYFHATIDLTVIQKQGTYSKSQAEQVVKNFFAENKPSAFTVNHSGTSGEGSKYIIGALVTSTGEYRVYIYFKNLNGEELIQTLRFELDE